MEDILDLYPIVKSNTPKSKDALGMSLHPYLAMWVFRSSFWFLFRWRFSVELTASYAMQLVFDAFLASTLAICAILGMSRLADLLLFIFIGFAHVFSC